MRWRFLLLILLAFPAFGQPDGYYESAEGKTGSQLREALHGLIRNHFVIPHSSSSFDTSDALKFLDEDPSNTNNVILIYSRRSEPKSTFGLSSGWNREHVWANSYGLDDQEPAFSDLHNLRAADATVNSARGNKLFDESDQLDPNYRVPGHIEAPETSTDTDSWEPPASVKGDIARALFYMDVRYEGGTNGEPDLQLTDLLPWVTSTSNNMARLGVLLKWHQADPVDLGERFRNERIFTLYQTNRNPFVDRPEWVRDVFWPWLTIVRSASTISLFWPLDYADAKMEISTDLINWTDLDLTSKTPQDNQWRYDQAGETDRRFFRLRW